MFFGKEAGGIYFTELDTETKFLKENSEYHGTHEYTERFTKVAVYGDGENLDFFNDGELLISPKNLINSPFCY